VLSAPDFPLINVGASDVNGERAVFSQGGPQLSVHAPGVGVEFSNKDGTQATGDGTSYGKLLAIPYSM
jgi:hypothetical protein